MGGKLYVKSYVNYILIKYLTEIVEFRFSYQFQY
jgi:hypothetical protein